MKDKKEKKIINIIEIVLGSIIILALIGTLILQLAAPELELSIWCKDNIWNVSASLDGLKAQLPEIVQCIIYIFYIMVYNSIF